MVFLRFKNRDEMFCLRNQERLSDKKSFAGGFTLVEIMVAVSIFVIVALIVTATLLAVVDANRRANYWRSIMESVNFATDSMSFKLKFGSDYLLTDGSIRGSSQIDFLDRDQKHIAYCHDELSNGKQAIFKCQNDTPAWVPMECGNNAPPSSNCEPITSTDIDVLKLYMKLADCSLSDNCPSANGENIVPNETVVIMIEAEVLIKNDQTPTKINFQTAVSQGQSTAQIEPNL